MTKELAGEETKTKNQVGIVTGGGSGLGRAMSLRLAREGAKVLVVEVRELEGKKVLEEIHDDGVYES